MLPVHHDIIKIVQTVEKNINYRTILIKEIEYAQFEELTVEVRIVLSIHVCIINFFYHSLK